MTLPFGDSQKFSILLEFATNEALFNDIEKKTENIVDATERAKEMTRLYSEEIKKTYPELYKQIEAEKKQAEALEKSKEAAKKNSVEMRNLRAEARLITKEVALLKDQAEDLDRVFRPLALVGGLITGGIFAAANKYVKDATEATQVTREWKAAQADLAQSGKEIGAVLAETALPLLKEVAQVSKQVAQVIKENPIIAKTALYGGLISLAVGTIGKLYTSGLRLYADVRLDKVLALQFAAAELQLEASENQLAAAGIQSKVPGGGKGGFGLGSAGIALTGLTAGVGLTVKVANILDDLADHLQDLGGKAETAGTGIKAAIRGIGASIPILQGFISKVLGDGKSLSDAANPSNMFLGGSKETQDQAVKVFSDWRRDDAKIVKDAMEERKKIISTGEKEIADITRNFVQETSSISRQFSSEAKQINERKLEADKKAEADFAKEHADILKEGEEHIQDIRNKAQEKRQDAEKEFTKAALQAGADRDALALVKAQEVRDEALAEADRGASEAIQKEKQETQQKLAELSQRYTQERAQRQTEYEQDIKENSVRRAAALKEAQDKYQSELKQQREAQAQKLKELSEATQQERIRRREGAISQLQDLGLVLNNERQLRSTAYNAMLGDLRTWLSSMNATFGVPASSLGTASGGTSAGNTNPNFFGSGMFGAAQGIHDYSGYAYRGIYKMAQNGKPEWVMSGNDTRAAENAIGGKLTSSSMAQMIALMAAARGSREFVDNSVYGKDMTVRQIRDIKEMSDRRIEKLLGGY